MKPVAVHARNPGPITGDGNWTWLIRGRVNALIDAGTGDPIHLDELAAALREEPLAKVIVTHGHADHASGAPAIKVRFPHVKFLKAAWPDRDGRWPVGWRGIADGDVIEAGDTTLVAIATPGHSPDHMCFWHEESRSLFCGDLAVRGTTVFIPLAGGDLAAYLASLERILTLAPERMYPAHGPVIDDPEHVLRNYIQHRHEREAQVIEALRAGDATADVMVERIYRGVKAALLPVARETILAHLVKLQRDGKAALEAGEWRLTIDD